MKGDRKTDVRALAGSQSISGAVSLARGGIGNSLKKKPPAGVNPLGQFRGSKRPQITRCVAGNWPAVSRPGWKAIARTRRRRLVSVRLIGISAGAHPIMRPARMQSPGGTARGGKGLTTAPTHHTSHAQPAQGSGYGAVRPFNGTLDIRQRPVVLIHIDDRFMIAIRQRLARPRWLNGRGLPVAHTSPTSRATQTKPTIMRRPSSSQNQPGMSGP